MERVSGDPGKPLVFGQAAVADEAVNPEVGNNDLQRVTALVQDVLGYGNTPGQAPDHTQIAAIDLDRGDLKWQVPYGETPDAVRNNPALKGMNIPNTGQPGSVGLVVTKTLVILGDSQVTTTPSHPRGAMLRAYDKATGKEVGAVYMPAPQSGSPMSYSVDGKQYIIVAVSGGAYSGEYIAYSLPPEE